MYIVGNVAIALLVVESTSSTTPGVDTAMGIGGGIGVAIGVDVDTHRRRYMQLPMELLNWHPKCEDINGGILELYASFVHHTILLIVAVGSKNVRKSIGTPKLEFVLPSASMRGEIPVSDKTPGAVVIVVAVVVAVEVAVAVVVFPFASATISVAGNGYCIRTRNRTTGCQVALEETSESRAERVRSFVDAARGMGGAMYLSTTHCNVIGADV